MDDEAKIINANVIQVYHSEKSLRNIGRASADGDTRKKIVEDSIADKLTPYFSTSNKQDEDIKLDGVDELSRGLSKRLFSEWKLRPRKKGWI